MTIALVAHDARKKELVEWAEYNKEFLANHELVGTGTTARLIHEQTGLDVIRCKSGPLGGDAQIAAYIAEGKVDCLIFFCDNLAAQGHQNDVFGLVRIASLYNIPFATNRTTGDYIVTSPLITDPDYKRSLPEVIEKYAARSL